MKKNKRLRKIIDGDKNLLEKGDLVTWTYRHTLNSKSSTLIAKKGLFIRNILTTVKDGGSRIDKHIFCLIQFEGNKNPSKIKLSEVGLT